ncbi:hypothetical protein EUX98_g4776 [Antrodiella citrinella]|uniref:Uncharacterized protein n=1 Tax=Antrodiella citrinella TaxID=2447956 RepID=A0A4S4MVW8_9APHY|nr:hypothetical protein EUX98_g4776 [Antrodiella citrinella]
MLATRFPTNLLVRLLGRSPQLSAVSGIAYCMSPPYMIKSVVLAPIYAVVYITFMLSARAIFSKTRIEVSGSGTRDIAKQLKDQQMVMAGHREGSMYKELKRVVPHPSPQAHATATTDISPDVVGGGRGVPRGGCTGTGGGGWGAEGALF